MNNRPLTAEELLRDYRSLTPENQKKFRAKIAELLREQEAEEKEAKQ